MSTEATYEIPTIDDGVLSDRANSCTPLVTRHRKMKFMPKRRRPRRVAKKIKNRGNAVHVRDAWRWRGPSMGLWAIELPDDLRCTSFLWSPDFTVEAGPVEPVSTSRCLHTFGYHGMFKPSIAEVMAQMPDDAAGADAFSIAGPETADDLNRELDALNAGYQVSEVTWYRRAKPVSS